MSVPQSPSPSCPLWVTTAKLGLGGRALPYRQPLPVPASLGTSPRAGCRLALVLPAASNTGFSFSLGSAAPSSVR